MKKIICLFLCVCILSFCVQAESNSNTDMIQEKLSLVKSRIGDTTEYSDFQSNVTKNKRGTYEYSFYWQSDDNGSMSVSVNDSNIITHYYKYSPVDYSSKPSLDYKSNEEIISAAKKFIDTINPGMSENLCFELDEFADVYAREYTVRFQRTFNGIKVKNNNGMISFSKDFKNMHSFYLSYTDNLVFDNFEQAIDKTTAVEKYKNKLGYKLCYTITYDTNKRLAELRYIPDYNPQSYIDAISGELVDLNNIDNLHEEGMKASNDNALSSSRGNGKVVYSEAELKEFENMQNLLSEEKIEESLRTNPILNIENDMECTYSYLMRDYYENNTYTYYFDFSSKDGVYCSVSCNAKTGKVIGYYRYDKNEETKKETISAEEVNLLAKSYVDKLAGDYFTSDVNNTFKCSDDNTNTGKVKAVRIVNGIECMNNGLELSVNPNNGKLESFSLNYNDIEFTSPECAISIDEAYNILFENTEYEMTYIPVINDKKAHGKLVYDFELYDITMSATEGTLVALYENKEKITDYCDVSDHYASNIINELKRFGIGFTGGEFKPDKIITQGEYVSLLAYVFNHSNTPVIYKTGNKYDLVYDNGEVKKWLKEYDCDENKEVTRKDACIIMVNAMGYGDIANFDSLFICNFKDVNENIGPIAILNTLGVVKGNEKGMFMPDECLTRADAAIMLYNFLAKSN